MNVAVVFDTPSAGWTHDDFINEVVAQVEEPEYEIAEALLAYDHDVRLIGVHDDLNALAEQLAYYDPDLVFNCAEGFHGRPNLDYLFPAIFEAEGYRYTGAPPVGLLLTRNKAMHKKVLAYDGVSVPGFRTWRPTEEVEDPFTDLHFPLIVKPLAEDASAGISQASVVSTHDALVERVAFVHESFSQPAIGEEFIEGRELYVSMVGNGEAVQILPIIEMVFDKELTKPEERIATRSAKWNVPYRTRKGIKNVFARPLAQVAQERIDEVCRTAFRALWLHDYARLDIRLTPDNDVWVIEANANPFISFGHDMANSAEKAGMDYYAFIDRIVREAMSRYEAT